MRTIAFDAKRSQIMSLDGTAVIMLIGALDVDGTAELATVLDPILGEGPTEVILNFSRLTFVDGSGIAALISAQHRLSMIGRHLTIRSPKPLVLKVFETTDLTDYLNVETSPSARELAQDPHFEKFARSSPRSRT